MFNNFVFKANFYIMGFLILVVPILMIINIFFDNITILYYHEVLSLLIPFEIFIYIYNLIRKNTKFDKYDVIILLWFLVDIIVTCKAFDIKTSIFGAYNRYEGLISVSCYYLLFLNAKSFNKAFIKKVISMLLSLGVLQFIYSFLQVFVRNDSLLQFELYDIKYMASGTIGNPNMLGSLCVLLICLSLSLYFVYKNKKYLILSVIFFINLLLTCSIGPFISFCIVFFAMSILFFKRKHIDFKKIGCIFILFLSTFVIFTNVSEIYFKKVFNDDIKDNYWLKDDLIKLISIPFKSSNNLINNESVNDNYMRDFSNGRIDIWKNTLKIVPDYFLLGAGLDNFGYVYPQNNLNKYVDKAHNEYLQILITEGVVSLLLYFLLIINLLVDSLRNNNKICLCLLMSFLGYVLQATFNIRVVAVAPIYFIIMGLLASSNKIDKIYN